MGFNTLVAILLACTTGVTTTLGLYYTRLWRALFLVNVFAFIALAVMPVKTAMLCLLSLSLVLLSIIWLQGRFVSQVRIKKSIARCLKCLSALCQFVHSTDITYSIRQHKKRKAFLNAISDLRVLAYAPHYQACLSLLDELYATILSLNALFYRVSDSSIFEVAHLELETTASCLMTSFQALAVLVRRGESFPGVSDALHECIRQLEEVHQSALQVVAPEPMVFMLFIHDISVLDELITRLSLVLETVFCVARKPT